MRKDKNFENTASLRLLQEISSRLSHALRGPLSVAQAAIKDMQRGVKLSEQDLQDGVDALRRTLDIIESLKNLSQPFAERIEEISLRSLLRDFQIHGENLQADGEILIAVQPQLFQSAVQYLFAYLDRLLRGSAKKPKLIVTVSYQDQSPAMEANAVRQSLQSIAAADHSVEAVGLLYAAEVFRLHGVCVDISTSEGEISLGIML